MVYDRIQKRIDVLGIGVVELFRAETGSSVGIEDRNLEHVLVVGKLKQKIIDFVQDFLGSGILTVDLVDYNYDRKVLLKGLSEHETCLRKRTFGCVDQKDYSVDH